MRPNSEAVKVVTLLIDAELLRGLIEGRDGLAQLAERPLLRFELRAVGVEAAELAEEYLAREAKLVADRHHLRDGLQLRGKRVVGGELGGEVNRSRRRPVMVLA